MCVMCKIGRFQQAWQLHFSWAGSNVYVPMLQSAALIKDVTMGKCTHALMIKTGFEPDIFVNNNLTNMYVKCGFVKDARQVFDKMPERNVVSWNGIIAGYVRHGRSAEALDLFRQMQEAGMTPNQFTFGSILAGTAAMPSIEEGKQLHALALKSGLEFDLFVQSVLVDMYVKCENIEDARYVFDRMPERDVVSLNSIIAGNVRHGYIEEALRLFCEMQQASMQPTQFTFASIFKACAEGLDLELGKVVHATVIKSRLVLDITLCNALIDMYAKCGSIEDAYWVFDQMPEHDEVSWNAILAGCTQNGHDEEVLKLFRKMQMADVKMDEFTFAAVCKACDNLVSVEQGKQVHALVIKTGFQSNLYVGTTLIDMFVNFRIMETAIQVFSEIPKRDVILWSVVISGYVYQGEGSKALKLFDQMQQLGLKPDEFTLSSVLEACAGLATLEQGKQIHVHIIHSGFESSAVLGSSLIDMYAKSGSINDACIVFGKMSKEDVASWNAMISGYAQHGHGREALELLREMQDAGIRPDHITFVGILYACSHLGLVDEGCYHFDNMSQGHGIIPRAEHYACMVDLLSRAGHLEEAECFINMMPFKPNPAVWRTVLAGCRIHGNVELGERVAECLFMLDEQDSATYVMLSNLYADRGRWNDAAKVRKMMIDRGLRKEAGLSWIEIQSKVHVFVVGN